MSKMSKMSMSILKNLGQVDILDMTTPFSVIWQLRQKATVTESTKTSIFQLLRPKSKICLVS